MPSRRRFIVPGFGINEAAAATIDLDGGPAGAEPFSPELHAAIEAGDHEAMQRLMMPSGPDSTAHTSVASR
jgi:hypothetical protein